MFGMHRQDLLRRLDPVATRHPDVHDDHVRLRRDHAADGLLAVASRRHDGHVGLGVDQLLEPSQDDRVIVHDGDGDLRGFGHGFGFPQRHSIDLRFERSQHLWPPVHRW